MLTHGRVEEFLGRFVSVQLTRGSRHWSQRQSDSGNPLLQPSLRYADDGERDRSAGYGQAWAVVWPCVGVPRANGAE